MTPLLETVVVMASIITSIILISGFFYLVVEYGDREISLDFLRRRKGD